MDPSAAKTLQLHPGDNVVVCLQSLEEGEEIVIAGRKAAVSHALGIGHKLACKNIPQGEIILKYGVPIGTATKDIIAGEHVHTHNIESNYIATYLAD